MLFRSDIVLENVTELYVPLVPICEKATFLIVAPHFSFFLRPRAWRHFYSETTPEGKKKTKLHQTPLNGNNICMVCVFLSVHMTGLANNLLAAYTGEQRT